MATFKVGMRVRVARHCPPTPSCSYHVGAQGVVVDVEPLTNRLPIGVKLPGHAIYVYFEPHELEPLTDPRAAEFIADMSRFAHLAKPKEIA